MPFFDLVCKNNHQQFDKLLKVGERPPCPTCGEVTETLWNKPSYAVGDECDVWIEHGLCNEDGTPRHFRFKSEIQRVAKEKGYVNWVEHVPGRGTDKTPVAKWVSYDPRDEAERVRDWWEHERANFPKEA